MYAVIFAVEVQPCSQHIGRAHLLPISIYHTVQLVHFDTLSELNLKPSGQMQLFNYAFIVLIDLQRVLISSSNIHCP